LSKVLRWRNRCGRLVIKHLMAGYGPGQAGRSTRALPGAPGQPYAGEERLPDGSSYHRRSAPEAAPCGRRFPAGRKLVTGCLPACRRNGLAGSPAGAAPGA
jgi:hypothetical protein